MSKKLIISTLTVLAMVASAQAQFLETDVVEQLDKYNPAPAIIHSTEGGAEAGLQCQFNFAPPPGTEFRDPITVPYNGINVVVNLDVAACVGLPSGSNISMNGIGWNVTIATVGGSWLSEAQIYFDDNINPDGTGLFLRPGSAVSAPGTQAFSSPVLKFGPGTPIPAIPTITLPNGMLRMEFGDTFDDNPGVDDLVTGFLTIQVTPEPATLALLGLGGLFIRRRK